MERRKRQRTEENYWECLEEYFKSRFGVNVTHSICEDCASKVIRGDQPGPRNPAARTLGSTWSAYWAKFSSNIPASFRAVSS